MYFLRVDYITSGFGVQRCRGLYERLSDIVRAVRSITADGYQILQLKVELCA